MKQRLIFSIMMSFILSLLMTCWITWINLGWSSEFFGLWFKAFVLAWPAAGLISFTFGPKVQSLAMKISQKKEC